MDSITSDHFFFSFSQLLFTCILVIFYQFFGDPTEEVSITSVVA